MSELNATASDSFLTAIGTGALEAASAFSRTFDTDVSFQAGNGGALDLATLTGSFSVPGLALTLKTGAGCILVLIPSNTGLIPDWCKAPDATGKSKLSTFAQELGMNIAPDDFFPEEFQAEMVGDLAKAATGGNIGPDAGFAELQIVHGNATTTAMLLWPIQDPAAVFTAAPFVETASSSDPFADPFGAPTAEAGGDPLNLFGGAGGSAAFGAFPAFDATEQDFGEGGDFDGMDQKQLSLEELPGFTKSVLKVKVPVAAVLARARRPIKSVLELGVGSIIQFDKACDEPLEIELDRTVIALGEAVKVGDKFGVQISTVLLPKERFRQVEIQKTDYTRRGRSPQIIGKSPIRSLESAPKEKDKRKRK